MSLYGALLSGVSSLRAQSQSLGAISDNIANVNTIGYKRTTAQFSTLVTGAGSTANYYPGGVRATPRALIDQQGVLQTSTRPTDVAILGNGFFIVNTENDGSGEQLYTRAGSFSEDKSGRLVNAAGYYLVGWALDQQGNIVDINTIQPVSVSTINGVAVDTTNVEIIANLNSGQDPGAVPIMSGTLAGQFSEDPAVAGSVVDDIVNGVITPHFSRPITVYDALGTRHQLQMSFHKLGDTGKWGFVLQADPTEMTTVAGYPPGLVAYGEVTFNATGGLASTTFYSVSPGPTPTLDPTNTMLIDWNNGAAQGSITMDFGQPGTTSGLRQFAETSTVEFVNQNGAEVGRRIGVEIDKDGYVSALFDNGATQRIFKLPIATFANPTMLEARNGNAYSQTEASGEFNLREANEGGAGRVEPSALEGSNVDLAEEFTTMITTQRAYSASAKTITTADEMLDELLRIKR